MKKRVNCILLIDDDEPTNFLHKILLEDMDCADEIIAMQNAEEALEFLKTEEDGVHPKPDLIFLDINMPIMNGWEFLEEYHKLPVSQKGKHVMVMLTTSVNPDDKSKAIQNGDIQEFINKPLEEEVVLKLIDNFF